MILGYAKIFLLLLLFLPLILFLLFLLIFSLFSLFEREEIFMHTLKSFLYHFYFYNIFEKVSSCPYCSAYTFLIISRVLIIWRLIF